MPRKSIAPWSERVAEGLIDQPIDSQISSTVDLRPTVDTGFIDQTGTWKGNVSSDEIFGITQTDIGIANGAHFITPSTNADGSWPLDMTGYSDILVAVKPSNAGNYACIAIMGPADVSFGNLTPVDAGATLLFISPSRTVDQDLAAVFSDGTIAMTANVWNIFMITGRAKDQKLLQFKITNNSGGSSDVDTAFMRLV